MTSEQLVVGVFFGGRSPEHDVSIVTGQQVLQALDPNRFLAIPIYVGLDGSWRSGPVVTRRSTFVPIERRLQDLPTVKIVAGERVTGKLNLVCGRRWLFGPRKSLTVDIVIPAFHGRIGEDGAFQGLMEALEIPYVGSGMLASAATMNKVFTKRILHPLGIEQLPCAVLHRPRQGFYLPMREITKTTAEACLRLEYPICVKPVALGSSIGVHRADDDESLMAAVSDAFRLSADVMLEPFLPECTEYNIAVGRFRQGYTTSDIERPSRLGNLLSFAEKYKQTQGGGPNKPDFGGGEGMANLGRTIDPPELSEEEKLGLRHTAIRACKALGTAGIVRVDFIRAAARGTILLNEINSIPGSFAYYLWRNQGLGLTELLSELVDEALARQREPIQREFEVPQNAQLFSRH